MAWQVGNGENILLGIDPIVGPHTSFCLPEDLRTNLEDLNMCTLSQAHNSLINAQSYWFTADDLNLGGTFKLIWTEYVEGLSGAGIRLTDRNDELVWVFNKKSGSISARNTYECIVRSSSPLASNPVNSYLWNKALPNKISCFIWLALRNRVLTWENLQKKGKSGPGICVLCYAGEETVEHHQRSRRKPSA